jgi:membrane protease YdiL (CAAX protease family)
MKVNYKIIGFLALLGLLAALLSLPYVYGLLGDVLTEARLELGLSESIYNAILIGQAAIIYAIAALIGGLLYQRAGFSLPLLERIFGQDEEKINLKPWFLWSAGIGVALAVVIIVGDYTFYQLGSPLSLFGETELPVWWAGLLAAISAGIGEELLMRFLLMTLLTLLFLKLFRMPRAAAVWSAIILIALVFGALHLPATAELVALTPLIIVRAMLLNGIGGIAFGLLYWKQGLESAMVAHFLTDVFVHGLMPLFV